MSGWFLSLFFFLEGQTTVILYFLGASWLLQFFFSKKTFTTVHAWCLRARSIWMPCVLMSCVLMPFELQMKINFNILHKEAKETMDTQKVSHYSPC